MNADQNPAQRGLDPAGVTLGAGAYLLWGIFPIYIALMRSVGALEVVAHRATWSFVLCLLLLTVLRRWKQFVALVRTPGLVLRLAVAAVFLSINWLGYVYGVNTGHTLDASFAYYINPLITVLLGVLVLGERLRRAQWVAVGLGTASVLVLSLSSAMLMWLSLIIAMSWALYGLTKKQVGKSVDALSGLTIETAVLVPFTLGFLIYLHLSGGGAFLGAAPEPTPGDLWEPTSGQLALVLIGSGAITTVPLLLFAAASRRLPLVVVGLLQFATPTMQFLIAVFIFGEPMPPARWAGFVIAWAAVCVMAFDIVRQARLSPARRPG